MLVDIPDASVMLVSVLAFLGGLVTLYLYTKIRSPTTIEKPNTTNLERIDYYEKELIDLKIRLDTMELDGEGFVDSVVYKKNTKPVTKHETKKHEDFVLPEQIKNKSERSLPYLLQNYIFKKEKTIFNRTICKPKTLGCKITMCTGQR